MRDTTLWRKDADRLRHALMEAFRKGDLDAAAGATQALEALLQRTDRPAPPVCKTAAQRRLAALRAWETRRAAAARAGGAARVEHSGTIRSEQLATSSVSPALSLRTS
jgi:hypothetical protein